MFTGIIEEVGKIKRSPGSPGASISIFASKVLTDVKPGDSIAVNGVCLTVTVMGRDYFEADVSAETLQRSSLTRLRAGQPANLERAARVGQPIGGHIVQGHIDEVGSAVLETTTGGNRVLRVNTSPDFGKYLVEKGSVAVDGISLTVARLFADGFEAALIPHTITITNLNGVSGDFPVNLEADIFAKYIYKYIHGRGEEAADKERLNEAFLAEYGYL